MKPKMEIDRREMLCPHTGFKKPCRQFWDRCAHAIERDRQYPDGTVVVVKCCSTHFIAGEQENLCNRLAQLHAETGELKNAAVFQAAAMLGHPAGRAELARIVSKSNERLTGGKG